ncbi:MAG: CpaF family protein [Coriobacteriales bacterium]|nr:CpaF family protein [Coriobacteriales bacterium]
MSLLEYLEQPGCDTPQLVAGTQRTEQRTRLRDLLYRRLPSKRIAALLAEDRQRAQREVSAVLEQIAQGQEYAHMEAGGRAELISEVLNLTLGLGPLEELLIDPSVTEIMVNGPHAVFYEREGKIAPSSVTFADEQQLRMVIDRIVGPLGRRVDEQSPLVSARLPQGHRINVVIPPLAVDGPVLTIRKFSDAPYTLRELVRRGTMSLELSQLLRWAVICRRSIAVSGGTGAGKTTLLNALSVEIPSNERIITIEDAAELRFLTHPHVVRLEARMRNAEGTGEVSIRDLVANALRMRPDRIVVGECRGAEALDMLQAMNTGHDGSMTTLHANSPGDVINRLVMMARFGMDLPVEVIEQQIATAFDLIVQIDRAADGVRRVTSVCLCSGGTDARRLDGAGADAGAEPSDAAFGQSGDAAAGAAAGAGAGQHGHGRSGVELQTLVSWNVRQAAYLWRAVPPWLEDAALPPAIDEIEAKELERWRACLTCC